MSILTSLLSPLGSTALPAAAGFPVRRNQSNQPRSGPADAGAAGAIVPSDCRLRIRPFFRRMLSRLTTVSSRCIPPIVNSSTTFLHARRIGDQLLGHVSRRLIPDHPLQSHRAINRSRSNRLVRQLRSTRQRLQNISLDLRIRHDQQPLCLRQTQRPPIKSRPTIRSPGIKVLKK